MAASTDPMQGSRMSDDDNVLGLSRRFRLTADVTALMLKGAGYAALFCFAFLLIGMVLLAISSVLPEASKQNPDPNPDESMLVLPESPAVA